jgi:hypothetical protein
VIWLSLTSSSECPLWTDTVEKSKEDIADQSANDQRNSCNRRLIRNAEFPYQLSMDRFRSFQLIFRTRNPAVQTRQDDAVNGTISRIVGGGI